METNHLFPVLRNVVSRQFAPHLALVEFMVPVSDDLPQGLRHLIVAHQQLVLKNVTYNELTKARHHAQLDSIKCFSHELWIGHGWRHALGFLMTLADNPPINDNVIQRMSDFGRVVATTMSRSKSDEERELKRQIEICRDIFAPHDIICAKAKSWLNLGVRNYLENIRKKRSFSLMKYLGDDLGDAGCDDMYLIEHCYTHCEHHIGCWVIDALYKALETEE